MSNEAAPASSLTDKEREAIAQMPYEEARDKLIQAVQALEAGGLNLDQSMPQARKTICLSICRGTAAPLTYGRSTGTSVKRLEPEQSGPITRHVESILCVQW